MIYKTSNIKLIIKQHKPHEDIGDELTFSEWVENPAHSVASATGTHAVILIKKNVSQYKI